jgi:hypothetical protein
VTAVSKYQKCLTSTCACRFHRRPLSDAVSLMAVEPVIRLRYVSFMGWMCCCWGHTCRGWAIAFVDGRYRMLCRRRVSNPSRRRGIWFIVVESASSLWNSLRRHGIWFVVVGSSSSSNLPRRHWIFVIVESASLSLNLSCHRRTCFAVVELALLVGRKCQ